MFRPDRLQQPLRPESSIRVQAPFCRIKLHKPLLLFRILHLLIQLLINRWIIHQHLAIHLLDARRDAALTDSQVSTD